MIPHVDLELSSALDQMERKDLGSRVWRRKMRGRELSRRAEHGEGEGGRECGLNVVGPKRLKPSSTGQTSCLDRSNQSGLG